VIIGRLHPDERHKGHVELVSIWSSVLERKPDAQLWVIGEGDLRHELAAETARLGLSESIKFFGHVDESTKQRLLERSRCLLMPSSGEGFGLTYLEAMRLGRPCLVGEADAGTEVVDPPTAGLACNPKDHEQLVDGADHLLTLGEQWEEWSKNARSRYEALFTFDRFEDRLLEALSLD
jgi:phosphatidylinositol alpha-1,6-mannosyltransferase